MAVSTCLEHGCEYISWTLLQMYTEAPPPCSVEPQIPTRRGADDDPRKRRDPLQSTSPCSTVAIHGTIPAPALWEEPQLTRDITSQTHRVSQSGYTDAFLLQADRQTRPRPHALRRGTLPTTPLGRQSCPANHSLEQATTLHRLQRRARTLLRRPPGTDRAPQHQAEPPTSTPPRSPKKHVGPKPRPDIAVQAPAAG